MFRQDCFVVYQPADAETKQGEIWMFLPTNPNAFSVIARVSKLIPLTIGYIMTDGKATYALVSKLEDQGLDVHITDMNIEIALFNVEQQALDFAQKELIRRASEHFEPLLDAAIAARDKVRIADLVRQFPFAVERSFIIDRLMYGADRFEELHQPGVTLDNWHLSGE